MPETREILSFAPAGNAVVFTQELRETGWHNAKARAATPDDLLTMTPPSPNEQPVLGRSGSSNQHARLSPSDSARWTECTAALASEQEHAERIFILDYDQVRQLVPYLETFPDELHDHEKRAIKIVKRVQSGKLKLTDLTPEQREDIRRSEGNKNSREGTRAHDFAEAYLTGRRTLDSIPEEFRQHVDGYARYCAAVTPPDAEVFVEHKLPLFYQPEEKGTTDYVALTEEKVVVIDYKHGAGKLVVMEDNTQLAIYGLSVIRAAEKTGMYFFEPDTVVEIHVYQPRHHEAASLKPWIMTLADLEAFCDREIGDKAAHVMSGEGLVFAPSDKACMWCKLRKLGCKAHADWASAGVEMPDLNLTREELLAGLPDEDDLAELDGVKPAAIKKLDVTQRLISRVEYATNGKLDLLSDEFTLILIDREDAIMGLIADAKERMSARVLSGEKVEGLKIVMGREGNRTWKSEAAARTFCENQKLKLDDYMPRSIAGPAVIEKIPAIASKLDEKTGVARTRTTFKNLISRTPARKTVVLASDKRPEVTSDIDEMPDDPETDETEVDDGNECG